MRRCVARQAVRIEKTGIRHAEFRRFRIHTVHKRLNLAAADKFRNQKRRIIGTLDRSRFHQFPERKSLAGIQIDLTSADPRSGSRHPDRSIKRIFSGNDILVCDQTGHDLAHRRNRITLAVILCPKHLTGIQIDQNSRCCIPAARQRRNIAGNRILINERFAEIRINRNRRLLRKRRQRDRTRSRRCLSDRNRIYNRHLRLRCDRRNKPRFFHLPHVFPLRIHAGKQNHRMDQDDNRENREDRAVLFHFAPALFLSSFIALLSAARSARIAAWSILECSPAP